MAGFSYRGINISLYNAYWIPNNTEWHIWETPFKTVERANDSQDGSNWQGNTANPKAMELPCCFEHITEAQLTRLLGLFDKDTSGKLVFDERPWIEYFVRPVKMAEVTKYPTGKDLYSGTFTVYLTAHYPFGLCNIDTLEDGAVYTGLQDVLLGSTGLIKASQMPEAMDMPLTEQAVKRAYNAGNRVADTIIRIAGDVGGTGLTLYNRQTKQTARIVGITKEITTNTNRWFEMDSRTGLCYLTDGSTATNGFQYHERGYIQLAPSAPVARDIEISYSGSNIVAEEGIFTDDSVGRSMFVDGQIATITSVLSPFEVVTDQSGMTAGSGTSDFVLFNDIVVTGNSGMSLTMLDIISKHTFS